MISASALDANLYGGKASGLSILHSLSLDVPPAFVVTANEPLDEGRLWSAVNKLQLVGNNDCSRHGLAIRSSSPNEDGHQSSNAGSYQSLLGTYSCRELVQAVASVRNDGSDAIPVIVQQLVDPLYSGVAFSCDPLTLARRAFVVSWVSGFGSNLVGGMEDGETVAFESNEDSPINGQWPHERATLQSLLNSLGQIEVRLGAPADVEWAIDRKGHIWWLQARPIVLPITKSVSCDTSDDLEGLHPLVADHPKLRLRRAAAKRSIPMSSAVIQTTTGGPNPPIPEIIPSEKAVGLSVVLLYPVSIEDRVQREFVQVDRMDVPLFTLGCRRYSIRKYPALQAVGSVVDNVLLRGLERSWLACAVVQEIYDAECTGIVRQLETGFMVEIARGHFVPKGVVDPSRLILSSEGLVVDFSREHQQVIYHFINGHVVVEDPADRQFSLEPEDIANSVMDIVPLFEDFPGSAIEFGLLLDSDRLHPYVIDIAESDGPEAHATLTNELVLTNVVSPGHGFGRMLRISNADRSEVDSHLLDQLGEVESPDRNIVVVADRASVDLLPLLKICGAGSAFVFRRASLLAHLSVVLRERRIPAVVCTDDNLFTSVPDGTVLRVDARSVKGGQRSRVTQVP